MYYETSRKVGVNRLVLYAKAGSYHISDGHGNPMRLSKMRPFECLKEEREDRAENRPTVTP